MADSALAVSLNRPPSLPRDIEVGTIARDPMIPDDSTALNFRLPAAMPECVLQEKNPPQPVRIPSEPV